MYMSKTCEYVENRGWRLNPHVMVSMELTAIEIEDVPDYIQTHMYMYRDGEFSLNPEYTKPKSETKIDQLEKDYQYLSENMTKLSSTVYGVDPDKLDLNEYKSYLREKNNLALADFLDKNPMEWTDGKRYSASKEDQSLIINNFSAYQLQVTAGAPAKLEWNSADSMCREFTVEEYCALMGALYGYAKKMVKLCQWYKVKIINAISRVDLEEIKLEYSVEKADEIIKFLSGTAEDSSV